MVELRSVVERAVIMVTSNEVDISVLLSPRKEIRSVVDTAVVVVVSEILDVPLLLSLREELGSVVASAVVVVESSNTVEVSESVSDWLEVRVVSLAEETPDVEKMVSAVAAAGVEVIVDKMSLMVEMSVVLKLALHGLAREPAMKDVSVGR